MFVYLIFVFLLIKWKFNFLNYVKLDWTPELHRKFVKAIEKLGVDKAVPSRILELMATHGLTRHNIASHLQVSFIREIFEFEF